MFITRCPRIVFRAEDPTRRDGAKHQQKRACVGPAFGWLGCVPDFGVAGERVHADRMREAVFCSRKPEHVAHGSVAFRFITGNMHPDHRDDSPSPGRPAFRSTAAALLRRGCRVPGNAGFAGRTGKPCTPIPGRCPASPSGLERGGPASPARKNPADERGDVVRGVVTTGWLQPCFLIAGRSHVKLVS